MRYSIKDVHVGEAREFGLGSKLVRRSHIHIQWFKTMPEIETRMHKRELAS